jgi:peptidyl-prolyl cis-trans isomerase SurA
LSASVHAEIMERIVAIVNGDIITLSELSGAFEPYKKKIDESYKAADKEKVITETRLSMLNKMIDNILIDQEAKKSGIVINDDEVMTTMNDLLSNRKMKMDDLLYELAKENSSIEAYKKELKDHLLRMKFLRREIKSRLAVSEEEIGDYYIKHQEAYEGKEAVSIRQILILFPKNSNENIKAKLREQMNAIHKRLQNGEPFDALAAQYSQEPAAAAGGDIGYIEKGSMLPVVDSVAFSLKKDEISEVIESPVGFHIIKVVDKRGAGIKPIASVREEIKTKIEQEKMDKKYEEWIKDLRSKSIIEIRLQ